MTAPPPGELAHFRAIFLKFYRISPHLLLLLYLLLPPAEVPAGREETILPSRSAENAPAAGGAETGTGRDLRFFCAADKKQLT